MSKKRPQYEILADLEAKSAALRRKIKLREEIQGNKLAKALYRATKDLGLVIDRADPEQKQDLLKQCQGLKQRLEGWLSEIADAA